MIQEPLNLEKIEAVKIVMQAIDNTQWVDEQYRLNALKTLESWLDECLKQKE